MYILYSELFVSRETNSPISFKQWLHVHVLTVPKRQLVMASLLLYSTVR
jgi:hypothetical protein